ncbi:MAG: DUF3352 domain-containing protein [Candidatus Peregrinibacteria bacterium]
MGKKSNAKKLYRELIKENENEKSKSLLKKLRVKKSKKELKKELKARTKHPAKAKKSVSKRTSQPPAPKPVTKPKKKKLNLKFSPKSFFGGALAIIMLAILASVGYLIFLRAFRPQPIAKFLPADNTVAFVEILSDLNHHQLTKSFSLLENSPKYSKNKLMIYVENKFSLNFSTDLEPWLGREVGAAIIKSQRDDGAMKTVYFAEVSSEKNMKNFIKSKALETQYLDSTIYVIPEGGAFVKINDYLFYAANQQTVEEIVDFQRSGKSLYHTEAYANIADNMPVSRAAFIYVNYKRIDGNFLNSYPQLGEKLASSQLIQPVIKMFDSEGMAIVAMDDKFAIQSFMNFSAQSSQPSHSAEESKFEFLKPSYTASLANFVSDSALAFWGGKDLENQLKSLVNALGGETLSALINSYTQKYFGPEISLSADILPLFGKEYALAIEQNEGQAVYKIMVEIQDSGSASDIIGRLADKFMETSAVFEPKTVDHVLPDGTPSKEIIAVPEEALKQDTEYKGNTVHEIKIDGKDWGIYYTILDSVAVISTNLSGITSAIDTASGKLPSLASSKTYADIIKPVLGSSDEVSYFNIEKLLPILFKPDQIPAFLKPISEISTGKNYFNSGIITINYLRIK